MLAKITFYNRSASEGACSDFSLNCFWGDEYKNVFYLCGDFGRPAFNDIIEVSTDASGQDKRIQNTSIERYNLTAVVSSPLLSVLKTIDKHDVKELLLEDTGDTFIITNVDIEDTGDTLTPSNKVTITFEDEPISLAASNTFVKTDAKQAFFDNNDELYFESDGVTPATSGNVMLQVKTVTQSGIEGLVGIYEGQFGDFLNDPTKWTTNQNLFDYFGNVNRIEHRTGIGSVGELKFDKYAYAEDNGYLSSETEDRAVKIIFELSIDGSTPQKTTLDLVYNVRGAFNSFGVQDPVTRRYGVTTIASRDSLGFFRKTTLSTVNDVRVPAGGGTSTQVTLPSLISVTPFTNQYGLDTAPAGETYYSGVFATPAGYQGGSNRGSFETDNFTISLDDATQVKQTLNVLNFTTGPNPAIVDFRVKYDRQINFGAWPIIGAMTGFNAECRLDGALVSTFTLFGPAVTLAFENCQITLPDTNVHTVRFTLTTNNAFEIFTEFQIQLKPLF